MRDHDRRVILAPYSKMDARIAITSWGEIDLLDEFDLERFEEFVSYPPAPMRGHLSRILALSL
jgi:hypothetical protein